MGQPDTVRGQSGSLGGVDGHPVDEKRRRRQDAKAIKVLNQRAARGSKGDLAGPQRLSESAPPIREELPLVAGLGGVEGKVEALL